MNKPLKFAHFNNRSLGVARETVSAWVTVRKQEPGGEAVLQMQAWLAEQSKEKRG